jgi:hypothetical protein
MQEIIQEMWMNFFDFPPDSKQNQVLAALEWIQKLLNEKEHEFFQEDENSNIKNQFENGNQVISFPYKWIPERIRSLKMPDLIACLSLVCSAVSHSVSLTPDFSFEKCS